MINDNLPPLPIPDKQGCEDDPMYGILPVDYYTAEQMKAYARAAIERQSVPADFETAVHEYIDDYEMLGETEDGRDGCYTPNENDKALLFDAFMGFDFSPWRAAAPQPQPVQQPVAWSERIKELADQYAIECVEFSKGIPNGAHSMSPIAVKAGDTRLALHSAIDTGERFIRAIESATLAAQVERATQPQPVQEQCPECDGTGTVSG